MSSQIIILAHDMWRKGAGGAPAGLVGQADSFMGRLGICAGVKK
jgi:fluoroquinolone resistance protein